VRNLTALLGIMRNEMLLQLKTKLFVMSLINSIVIVILWGYLAGLQAQPMNHLKVGVVEGSPIAQTMLSSGKVAAVVFPDRDAAKAAVLEGRIIAMVYAPAGTERITVLLDDTQGAAARTALANITTTLLGTLQGGQNAYGTAFAIEEAWGLDMNDPTYLLRLLGSGLAAMVVLSNAFVFSGFTLIAEKTSGTIYFLALAPISRLWVVLGKLVANTLLILASTIMTVLIAVYLFGITPTGSLWLLVLAALLTGVGLMGLCYAISAYVKDERTFRIVAGLPLMMPMMLLSGIMYPVAIFPTWLQSLSELFPLAWMMEVSHAVFFKGGGFADVWQPLTLLAAFAVTMVLWGGVAVSRLMRVQ